MSQNPVPEAVSGAPAANGTAVPGSEPALHELKPNAIGLLQSTVIAIAPRPPGQASIQLTARFQMVIAAIEYVILLIFSGIATYAVFIARWAGTIHPSLSWLSPNGVGGKGSLVGGALIAVYLSPAGTLRFT